MGDEQMRCDCCDKRLSDYESTLKSAEFGCYMNTCLKCLKGLNISVLGREDLITSKILEDEYDDEYYDFDTEQYYVDKGKQVEDNIDE